MTAHRRIRTIAAGILLLACAGVLSGCFAADPRLAGVMGLGIVNGHVEAQIRMCSGVTAKSVTVEAANTSAFSNPYRTWKFKPTNSGGVDLGSVGKFEAVLGSKDAFISSSSTDGAGGFIYFNRKDVNGLQTGEVLTTPPDGSDSAVVSQFDFEKARKDLCG